MYTFTLLFVYNFLQFLAFIPAILFAFISSSLHHKYQGRILSRLGLSKNIILSPNNDDDLVIWIHALSVGEVTSAVPLVRCIYESRPDITVIFSATTSAGRRIANKCIAPYVTEVIDGPLDFLFTIKRYIHAIRPSLFVLVETDFWPNWLNILHLHGIPTMLVNGRISEKSWKAYTRLRLFFKSMFRTFTLISMQTKEDSNKMIKLGVEPNRIAILGNLKYDTALYLQSIPEKITITRNELGIRKDNQIWICGSTHEGEESIIFDAFNKIRTQLPNLLLILAPRNIERSFDISNMAQSYGLSTAFRSKNDTLLTNNLLLVDTIGELVHLYKFADIAFVGGSLVPQGGHNPLEPAAYKVPVVFGPHMEDFREISNELKHHGGAITVQGVDELAAIVTRFLQDKEFHNHASSAAAQLIKDNAGVAVAHLHMIERMTRSYNSTGS
ncbi:MAG: 3-deoxy-D-manno-octulosonic acid transferase [Desulfobulbaceae bacterium]|nr:3-deoxy-D-manno-octulosonic acid transferase [Desulfobulbaceae bacterium]